MARKLRPDTREALETTPLQCDRAFDGAEILEPDVDGATPLDASM